MARPDATDITANLTANLAGRVCRALGDLAPCATRLLVAVSGGPDSVALLRLLLASRYELHVAHYDHTLRDDSAEDAAFVRALCETFGLPFYGERADVASIARARGWNLEDAARRLRYAFLTRTAKRLEADAVVTGHSRDDQSETVLLQLFRGAAFLRGMRARHNQVVRPLLGVPKAELVAYLNAIGQGYRTDPTNSDTHRHRAYLRHYLLPRLRTRYPALDTTLARLADVQQQQETHLDRLAMSYVEGDSLELAPLTREDPAVQRHAVATLLKRAGVRYDLARIDTLRAHLADRVPYRLSLSASLTARVAYGRLELLGTSPHPLMAEPATTLPLEVDPTKVAPFGDLVYRSRHPGDTIRLSGGRKKVSDLLIDHKVPRESRDGLRLLASGSEVLWLDGVATDVRVAARNEDEDIHWMRLALAEARAAANRGELPVGAVVVRAGNVLSRSGNTTQATRDPTAHAELLALREAARVIGDWRLADCTLYVTLEPCPMCFGAMLAAHLPRVVYGAMNRREGALGGVSDLNRSGWKRRLSVRGGVLSKEASSLLSAFFASRRGA